MIKAISFYYVSAVKYLNKVFHVLLLLTHLTVQPPDLKNTVDVCIQSKSLKLKVNLKKH